ncbi:MAG: acetyl-CoA carboxylase [Pseudomonadota bacterium]
MGGKEFTINAPLSGTFYRSPSPEDPPYVEVGDQIEKGTVVCIVETMKIFNEVRAERRGIVREILLEDEDSVMTGQPLYKVEAMQ